VFSYLYPFSHTFYRKFGYELCCAVNEVIIQTADLAAYPRPKKVTVYRAGDDMDGIKAVYEAFAKDLNLSVIRSDADFRKMLDKDGYKTKQFTNVHHGDDGVPDCYAVYEQLLNGGSGMLHIKELAWSSPSGLRGMLGFLAGLAPQFKQLKWYPPSNISAYSLIPECYSVSQKTAVNGMARIINLEAALGLMRYPVFFAGQAVLSVTDKFFPANTGVYRVEWDKGQGRAVKLISGNAGAKPDITADITTDIETISQLMTGFLTPEEVQLKDSVRISGDMDVLTALFPKKALYIYEKF
jgi:predicted acetyltransferase